jgi:hypothetical protein
MKMSTISFLLLTGLDQLDRLNGLDQVMYVGIDSHFLLEMGNGKVVLNDGNFDFERLTVAT